jgi:hypothetical protein
MYEQRHDSFELEDFILDDPFHEIYMRKRDEESDFFYIHTDYFQYLQYMNITWNRIKKITNPSVLISVKR